MSDKTNVINFPNANATASQMPTMTPQAPQLELYPSQPTAPPTLPYKIEIREYGYGKAVHKRPTKIYADGRPSLLATDDEIAVWAFIRDKVDTLVHQLEEQVNKAAELAQGIVDAHKKHEQEVAMLKGQLAKNAEDLRLENVTVKAQRDEAIMQRDAAKAAVEELRRQIALLTAGQPAPTSYDPITSESVVEQQAPSDPARPFKRKPQPPKPAT